MQSFQALLFIVYLACQCSSFVPLSSRKKTVRKNSSYSNNELPSELFKNTQHYYGKPNDFSALEEEKEAFTSLLVDASLLVDEDDDDEYDPSDAFAGESLLADLAVDELEEEFAASNVGGVPDLDGNPLSTEDLARYMGVENNKAQSYTCPQEEIFRGFMSNGCRLHLQPGGETAFYKSIFFAHLSHAQEKLRTAPFKLARDAKSYQVVADFLNSKACQAVTETTGVCIPKCYHSELRPNMDNPIETKCSFLLEDLSPDKGWYQQWLLLDQKESKAALQTMAKMHAFFWSNSNFWKNDPEAGRELEAAIWESGSYVQPKAQNSNQCEIVEQEWKLKRTKFEKELSNLDCWDDLGERLQRVATECGRLAHPFAEEPSFSNEYQKFRTFTHGDPKQANFLFRSPQTTEEKDKPLQVGLIDFQWTGFGLAATDIAHFMTSAVHASLLEDGGEDLLLQYYFDELQTALVEYGAYDTPQDALEEFSYDTFLEQYEVGVLDICRLMIAYTWDRFDQAVEPDDPQGCARTMNKTSYNKSIPNVIWLISKCDEILTKQEVAVAKMMLLGF